MINKFLATYFKNRPWFIGLMRARELVLFNEYFENSKSKPAQILDYGCGDGFFAKVLFDSCDISHSKLIGIDINNKDALELARKSEVYSKVMIYDAEKMDIQDQGVNMIISNCVLEHVVKLDHDLLELNRVLKKDGEFYCSVATDHWERNLLGSKIFGRYYDNWMRKQQDHSNLLSLKEWEDTFHKAGFRVDKVTGYIDSKATKIIDMMHYFSVPSLLSYKLFGKWHLFPKLIDIIPFYKLFTKSMNKAVDENVASGLFFKLVKN